MKKPFVTLQTTLTFSQTLQRVLEFHLSEGATIIDPTPGEKHSWKYYLKEASKPSFLPLMKFNIIFIEDDISNFTKTRTFVRKNNQVDAIFFDPPYIFGHKKKQDPRREDYGGYHHTFKEIQELLNLANKTLPIFLKENGLLFFKYSDVFSLEERKFYLCASLWIQALNNFEVIDHYIIPHHHISPTAWQVKDRPCGIVNYTYLTVLKRKGGTF